MRLHINNSSGAVTSQQVELNFTSPQNLSGASVTFFVNVDASLLASNGSSGVQTFDMNSGYTAYESNGANITTGQAGTWVQVVHNSLANGTVIQLGIQLYNIPVSATGNIYIDDVSIIVPTLPTATPTNTPTTKSSWTYEDNTTDYWAAVYGPETAAVTALATLNSLISGTGTDASTYGLVIHFPAGLTGTTNDGQVEVNAASGSPIIGTSMNWTSLNITQVTFQYWVSPTIGDYNSTIYPYVRANGNAYGGAYLGTGSCGGGGTCAYVASNVWQTVTFIPSGGTWTTDKATVTAVGAEANIGSGAYTNGGDYVIDNVLLQ